jgi:DNA-binding transcriptional LysR family regulator
LPRSGKAEIVARAESIGLLDTFIVVAEELSFRRAAARLNIDQSALTRRIQKLENQVGVQLLVRSTHNVRLTDAGLYFLEANCSVIDRYMSSIKRARSVSEGLYGHLSIGYMNFAGVDLLPRAVKAFRESFPDVLISLLYVPSQLQQIQLSRNEIDIGYTIGPIQNQDIDFVTLRQEDLFLIVPAASSLANRPFVPASTINSLKFIMGDDDEWSFYRWKIESLLRESNVSLEIVWKISNITAIFGMVSAGCGVTILPECMKHAIPSSLVSVPITGLSQGIEIQIAWSRTTHSSHIHKFLSLIKDTDL